MLRSGGARASTPTLSLANVSRSAQTLNTASYVEKESVSTSGTAFIVQHVYADITGDVTHTISGKIRFTFDDATTVDGAVGTSTTTKNILHYDNSAATSVADAWATSETAVNLLTVLGAASSTKKVTKISLFLKENAATSNAVYAWAFKVSATGV